MIYPIDRPEIELLKLKGYKISNPHDAVDLFEKHLAQFTGATYAVATDSLTHAIELVIRLLLHQKKIKVGDTISVPKHTYISIPQMLNKLRLKISWNESHWQGVYQLNPLCVADAALRFKKDMHVPNLFQCLSFQIKKRLPIGRGGAILVDNYDDYIWLRKACYDGRNLGVEWKKDSIEQVGYHYYMTPEDAARGLLLMLDHESIVSNESDLGDWSNYPDISKMKFAESLAHD